MASGNARLGCGARASLSALSAIGWLSPIAMLPVIFSLKNKTIKQAKSFGKR
jgi:hypothetical protein